MNEPAPETGADTRHEPVLYGKQLQQARKQLNLSVDDVAQAIHIKAEIIEALESSATEGLPPPAFVQGYLRAYARHVDVPVEQVLHDFSVAVPHQTETELRARSRLPAEASSRSPAVKMFTLGLALFIGFALLYSLYSYYTGKVSHIARQEQPAPPEIEQHARISESGELIVDRNGSTRLPLAANRPEFSSLAETLQTPPPQQADAAGADSAAEAAAPPPLPAAEDDIMIYADADSWVEITDAAGRSLYYNMLREGEEREFTGTAPFDVFFGNAPAITLRVNDVDIDMTKFIRSNNIAGFRVSTEEDEAVFHPRRR